MKLDLNRRSAASPGDAPPSSARILIRRWAPVAAAAALWWFLYSRNRPFWNWVVFDVFGMYPESHWGEAVHFFFYDITKIALLVSAVIFVVTVLRSFLSVERTRSLLGGRRQGLGNVAAAGLGVVTPFCSCSAVPVFIGFVAAGVPLGVTMSFLIASPMVDLVAVSLLFSLFGWQVTAIYVAGGFTVAVVAGMVMGRLGLERWVEPFVLETRLRGKVIDPSIGLGWDDRLSMGREEVVTIIRKIWPYVVVGIGLGAVIHGWVPADWFAANASGLLGVPIAVLVGVPLYTNIAGVLPLADALYAKGLPMGTVLAFMMSVVALSLPEMILLRRVLRPKLIATCVAVVASGILATGFVFNLIL
jgi:uncharacterized membrane protein YraQ (UPF0718 family)